MGVIFRYLGISAFDLTIGERVRVLIDPCISKNVLCPVSIEDLTDVDLILVTHGAADHMGDAIEIQKRTGATIVSEPAVRVHAWRNGVERDRVVGVLWGDEVEIMGVKIKAVECRHVSFFLSGDVYLSGLPLSFIIYPEEGARIYNAGDTALFSDMRLIGELYRPNIALIPIGGAPGLTGGYSHLPPNEAALATRWIGPEYVIPTHYRPDTEEASIFKEHVELLAPSTRVIVMKPGEALTYDPKTHRFG